MVLVDVIESVRCDSFDNDGTNADPVVCGVYYNIKQKIKHYLNTQKDNTEKVKYNTQYI